MTPIVKKAISQPPVDTTYVAGRWHPARVSLRGIWTEARVLGASLTQPTNRDVSQFLILCRARSGSTLLTQLLNAHPDITCDREVLARRVLFPHTYLRRLAHKSRTPFYGAKLLSYQMVQVQKFQHPAQFLRRLHDDGVRFVHVQRDSFAQTLSLITAQSSRIFHHSEKAGVGKAEWRRGDKASRGPITVDPDDFVKRLSWSRLLLEYENHCLADLPCLRLNYDADLLDQTRQQAAADQVLDWIGASRAPVSGALRKLLPSDPRAAIDNYDAVADAVRRAGLGQMLPSGQ